jgi:hypothetical protein
VDEKRRGLNWFSAGSLFVALRLDEQHQPVDVDPVLSGKTEHFPNSSRAVESYAAARKGISDEIDRSRVRNFGRGSLTRIATR